MHFGEIDDDRKDSTAPHITFRPQLDGHRWCGLAICTFHLGFSLDMLSNPAIRRRNALIGTVMLALTLGLAFALPFRVEAAPPNAPTNLIGFVTSQGGTLTWDAPSGGPQPDAYRLLRRNIKNDPNAPFLIRLDDMTGPPQWIRDSNSMGGSRKYEYAIVALNGDEASEHSNYFTALVPAKGLSNDNTWRSHSLTATHSGSQVTLNWEVISTAGVQGYRIRKKVGGGKFTGLVSNTRNGERTYIDTDVQAGKTYTYRIRAHYEYGSMKGKGTTSAPAQVAVP